MMKKENSKNAGLNAASASRAAEPDPRAPRVQPREADAAAPSAANPPAETPAPADTAGEIGARLAAQTELARDYYDQLLRLRAEFDNYRRRVEREKSDHRAWGKMDVLAKQISILDIMNQAVAAAKTTQNIEGVVKGLEMIVREFEKMLAEEGVARIDTGGMFDPHLHEAVDIVEEPDADDGAIRETLQDGYIMKDRVIRPARVRIAKNKKPDKNAQEEI